jgi:isopentenyl-diphosphate delta-isomerase
MTGGHPLAESVNSRLAGVASHYGIPMGLGSQRAHVVASELLASFRIAREAAPDLFLIANIGGAQLIEQNGQPPLSAAQIAGVVEAVEANALAVHLNPIQEMVQPGGDRRFRGIEAAIERLCDRLEVPVMVKETGGGISREVAGRLAHLGVRAIDVGGLGGTNMARIEASRAQESGETGLVRLGERLAAWGIPTAISIVETAGAGVPVIGTGGVRDGFDAAKALALGATLAGVARRSLSPPSSPRKRSTTWWARSSRRSAPSAFSPGPRAPRTSLKRQR